MEEDYYIQLIQKRLTGEISTEEDKTLSSWLLDKVENQQLYDQITRVWTLSDAYQPTLDVDLDQSYAEVQKRIRAGRGRSINLFIGIAASLAILVLSGLVFFKPNPTTKTFVAEHDNHVLELPDGSIIRMKQGSKIAFPRNMSSNRAVEFSGAAFFDIVSKAENPFTISGPHAQVTVLGTSFLLEDSESSETGQLQLLEGKVQFKLGTLAQDLLPGDAISFAGNKVNKQAFTIDQQKWYQHIFVSNNRTLENLMNELEIFFNTSIELNEHLLNCTLSGNLEATELSTLLENIAIVFGAEVQHKDNTWYLNGGSCN